jgi:prepilin-type N-terminal cleavage/methylation domain-containing protein
MQNGPQHLRSHPARTYPARAQQARKQKGFTLVELAIVLVVIGLILGGVFKGQSLIDSARVRSLSSEVSGIRTAWYSFQERYRSVPGDFSNAATQIDSAALPGNGNGRIDDGQERAGVWQQLALAGLINGDFDGRQSAAGSATDNECRASTCPKNPFNGFYKISYSAQAADAEDLAHEIYTGNQIPASILAELDLKLDDGKPQSGRFRVHRDYASACTRDGQWDAASGHANCAGVLRD